VFRTFDGLELDIVGRKDGARTFVILSPQSTSKESQPEAEKIAARVKGWEFEIPSYKYDAFFRPIEDLLKKLPEKPQKSKGSAPSTKSTAPSTKSSAPSTKSSAPSTKSSAPSKVAAPSDGGAASQDPASPQS